MANWTKDDLAKAMDAFMRKATTDKAFRAQALKDPAGAIKTLTGKDVPKDFKLKAVERDDADIVVIVPDLVKTGGELSDSELEQVAGGGRCMASCAASLACAVSSTLGAYIPGVGGACA